MPKQILKIDRFEGGLNSSSDARDIEDNQVSVSDDINISDIGKLRPIGGFSHNDSNIPDLPLSSGVTKGRGAFAYGIDSSRHITGSGPSSTYIDIELIDGGAPSIQSFCIVGVNRDVFLSSDDDQDIHLLDENANNQNTYTPDSGGVPITAEGADPYTDEQHNDTFENLLNAFSGTSSLSSFLVEDYQTNSNWTTAIKISTTAAVTTTPASFNGWQFYFYNDGQTTGGNNNFNNSEIANEPFFSTPFSGGQNTANSQIKIKINQVRTAIYTAQVDSETASVSATTSTTATEIASSIKSQLQNALGTANYNFIYESGATEVIVQKTSSPVMVFDSWITLSSGQDDSTLEWSGDDELTIFVSNDGNIHRLSRSTSSWDVIGSLGQFSPNYTQQYNVEPNFLLSDGNLRISDSQFENNSNPIWYGRIQRQLFESSSVPTPVDFEGLLSSEIKSPSNSTISESNQVISNQDEVVKTFSLSSTIQTDLGNNYHIASTTTDNTKSYHTTYNLSALENISVVTEISVEFEMVEPSGGWPSQIVTGQGYYSYPFVRIGTEGSGTRNFDTSGFLSHSNTVDPSQYPNSPNAAMFIGGTSGTYYAYTSATITKTMFLPINDNDLKLSISAGMKEIDLFNNISTHPTVKVKDITIKGYGLLPDADFLSSTGNNFHIQAGRSSIESPSWNTDDRWKFGASFIYDGKQESLVSELTSLSNESFTFVSSDNDDNEARGYAPWISLNLKYLGAWNQRITGINIYLKRDTENEWYQFTELNLVKGQIRPSGSSNWINCFYDDSNNGYRFLIANGHKLYSLPYLSYESLTGINQDEDRLFARYKTATVANRTAYIGNVRYYESNGEMVSKADGILKSPINKFDIFTPSRILEAAVNDGDEIIKLESYADRLLQFKKRKLYVINVSQEVEFLESVNNNLGINNEYASMRIEFGVIWVNKNGCYLYNGKSIVNLLERDGKRTISEDKWTTFLTVANASGINPAIGYYPNKKQIIVFDNAEISNNIFLYDMVTKSWTKGIKKVSGDIQSPYSITNSFIDDEFELNVFRYDNDNLRAYKWSDDSFSTDNLNFTTKDYDFGNPGQRKKIYKVYLSYKGDATAMNVQYYVNGDVDTFSNFYKVIEDGSSDNTNSSITPLSDYQKGTDQWFTAELKPSSSINNVYSFGLKFSGTSNSDFAINDISIVYRLKTIK